MTVGAGQLAIEARNVGVDFDVRLSRQRTFRLTVNEILRGSRNHAGSKFRALEDVSFSVERGHALGIIGRNGSGKTTLVLTIAGLLRPDRGVMNTFGSTSTLLTLGAGFEPELSGRENIYLNGAFFGLSRRAIDSVRDGIIEFSELGDFIDAPLRTYSSGMRTRLGFSIAVHIEPDILLLDEVLGVGDAPFRRKSLAKLKEVMTRAAAIVVVTHDMKFVEEMCTRVLWIDEGRAAAFGSPGEVVPRYLDAAEQHVGPVRRIRRA